MHLLWYRRRQMAPSLAAARSCLHVWLSASRSSGGRKDSTRRSSGSDSDSTRRVGSSEPPPPPPSGPAGSAAPRCRLAGGCTSCCCDDSAVSLPCTRREWAAEEQYGQQSRATLPVKGGGGGSGDPQPRPTAWLQPNSPPRLRMRPPEQPPGRCSPSQALELRRPWLSSLAGAELRCHGLLGHCTRVPAPPEGRQGAHAPVLMQSRTESSAALTCSTCVGAHSQRTAEQQGGRRAVECCKTCSATRSTPEAEFSC